MHFLQVHIYLRMINFNQYADVCIDENFQVFNFSSCISLYTIIQKDLKIFQHKFYTCTSTTDIMSDTKNALYIKSMH